MIQSPFAQPDLWSRVRAIVTKPFLSLAFTAFCAPVQAEQDCAKIAMFKDHSAVSKDYVIKTALIESMNEEEWNSHKEATSGRALVYGVPAEGTLSAAKEWATRFQRNSGFYLSQRNRTLEVTSRLSDVGLAAYKACLAANSNDPLVLIARATPTLVVIEGIWRPTTFEAEAFQELEISAVNAKLVGSSRKKPPANSYWSIQFVRRPADEVSVLVTMNFQDARRQRREYSREVYVPPFVALTVEPESRQRESELYYLRPGSGQTFSSAHVDIRPTEGYDIVVGSQSVNWIICRSTTGPQPDCKALLTSQPHLISGVLTMTHPPAHAGEVADAKIRWTEERLVIRRDGLVCGQESRKTASLPR